MVTTDDLDHVAYIGSFTVAGLLYRGDLFRDVAGAMWAMQVLIKPDGSFKHVMHPVAGKDESEGAQTALSDMLDLLRREGYDMASLRVIHPPVPSRPVGAPLH